LLSFGEIGVRVNSIVSDVDESVVEAEPEYAAYHACAKNGIALGGGMTAVCA